MTAETAAGLAALRRQHVGDERFAIELQPGLYLAYAPLSVHAAVVEADTPRSAVTVLPDSPTRRPGPRRGELLPDLLVLLTTRGCNIACTYCDFSAGISETARLSVETGAQAIEWFAQRQADAGRDELRVHFFGGEPFVGFREVVALVHYARAAAARYGLSAAFEASSNGVYPTDRARWVAENFDQVMLSFDGPQSTHDELRVRRGGGGTFDTTLRTARILAAGPVDLYVRCCVTEQTVGSMAATADYFARELRPSAVGFEPIKPGPTTDASGHGAPEPLDFARGFAAATRALEPYGIPAVLSSVRVAERHASFCPVGNDGMVVTPEGTVQSCYLTPESWQARGLDLRYGSLDADGLRLDAAALERSRALVVQSRPRCTDCFARWHCAGGCHVDHTWDGAEPALDAVCVQTRLLTAWVLLRNLGLEAAAERWLDAPLWAEVGGR